MRSAVLALALFLAAPAAADDLETLSRDFWTWRAVAKPMTRDDVERVRRPHGWVPDWTPESLEGRRRTLALFEERLGRISDPGRPVSWQVDRRLVVSALARVRWELDVKRSWRRDPTFWVDQTLPILVDAMLAPPPFDEARSLDVAVRLESIPRTLDEARALLDESAAPFARLALDDLAGIGPRLRASMTALAPQLAPEARGRVVAATPLAVTALESFRSWLEARLPLLQDRKPVARAGYEFFLRNVALLPYTPEELLLMGRQEYDRAVEILGGGR